VNGLEPRLVRLYGLGVLVGIGLMLVGLVFRPLLWFAVGALFCVPFTAAILVWREARRTGDAAVSRAVLMAIGGLVLAVVIGLVIPKG
jgi:hypothetical protein